MSPKARFTFLLLSLATLHCVNLSAQSSKPFSLNGRIIEAETGNPVAYATVTIADTLMSPVNAVAADMTGKFNLDIKQSGTFKLIVSYVGYTTYIEDFEIKSDERKVNFGDISLSAGVDIEEVSVVIQKPLIKVDPDKMSYSVEADPQAEYSSLAEILRKVPQLSVDAEDNVLLNGKSDYKVLVNGKSSGMMTKNFKEVIKSMPANSVKDIEVITNPSTKYESEGVGGIINIITNRQSALNGYTGMIGGGYGSHGDYSANAYISAQIGKFNFSTNYWMGSYNMPLNRGRVEITNYATPESMYRLGESRNKSKNENMGLSFESSYEIDTFNLVTLSVWWYKGSYHNEGVTDNEYRNSDQIIKHQFLNRNRSRSNYNGISGSLDYQRTFLKPGRLLTFSYKLDGNPSSSNGLYDIEGVLDYPSSKRKTNNKSIGNEHTFQVDYYDPLTKKHNIEAGIKYILRTNTSDTEEYDMDAQGVWIPNRNRVYSLDYDQHIYGIYGGYLYKLDKLTAKAGFRAEGTVNKGKAFTKDGSIDFDNDIFNIVPYVNLSYMLKPTQTLRLSYTQRSSRPGIDFLNPYVYVGEDPSYITHGNPNLKAALSHSFNVNYSLFTGSSNIFLGADYSIMNNGINNFTTTETDPETGKSVISTTYLNIGRNRRVGLSASYNYRYKTILSVYVSGSGNYSYLESVPGTVDGVDIPKMKNSGFSLNGNAGANITLWKDAQASVNAGIFTSSVELQGSGSTYHYSGFGLTQRFFKQKLSVSVSISDPFNKYKTFETSTEQEGIFSMSSHYRQQSRRITLRASLRFGQMNVQVKKAQRTINNDDLMSGGSGGGSQGGK